MRPEGEPLVLAKPYFSLDAEGSLTLHHVPVPSEPVPESAIAGEDARGVDRGGRLQWLRSLVSRMGPDVKNRVQRLTGYQPVPGYDRADHPDWRLMKAILTQWIGELETPVVICPIPLYHFIEESASPDAYLARFAELHDPPRVRVHDPLPDFQRAPLAERRGYRFELDCHLTPAAHQVLGDSLARVIEPLLKEESA